MDARPQPSGEGRDRPTTDAGDALPPILGSWRALYAVVVGELVIVILLCGWLNRWGR